MRDAKNKAARDEGWCTSDSVMEVAMENAVDAVKTTDSNGCKAFNFAGLSGTQHAV